MRVRYSFSSRKTRVARAEGITNKHKVAFPKLAKDVIKISDIVLEVLDARFIDLTRNKEIESYIQEQNKLLIYVINKADLVNKSDTIKYLTELNLYPYVLYSCKSPIGRKQLRDLIKILVKKEKFAKLHTKAHVGVVGYPNAGKSSLINTLVGGGKAIAASESGFTKGVRRIRFNKDILILDTPGVFGTKENAEQSRIDLKNQTEIGVRNASSVKNPEFVVHKLMQDNPGLFEEFYDIKAEGDAEVLLEELGKKKGFIQKGNVANTDKTARYILSDWQVGKIKRK